MEHLVAVAPVGDDVVQGGEHGGREHQVVEAEGGGDRLGQGVEAVRPIRDDIRRRVEQLVASLT